MRLQHKFEEASEQVREYGHPEAVQNNKDTFHVKCLLRKHDLVDEVDSNGDAVLARVFSYGTAVKEVIKADREAFRNA